ncbi:hypothetical protein ACERZ8_14160 [Tateyamaria armeniaca]|uniref:MotA/TolQ/ExbB proton channel domain-containing protein n=1 Tax=Tateyamaria armeniaca TaxID=2518930 RepID=A0ABW8UZ53_9RHOB
MADPKLAVRASSVSLGITVILLYAIFVSMVTFGFGTYIFRTTWQSNPPVVLADLDEAEVDTDIDNNVFLLRREKALENDKLLVAAEIRELRQQLADNEAAVKVSFGPIAREREEMRLLVNRTILDLQDYQYALIGLDRLKYETVLNDESLQPFARLTELFSVLDAGVETADMDEEARAAYVDMSIAAKAALQEALSEVEAANAASHTVQQEGELIEEKIAARAQRIRMNDEQIAALRRVMPLESVIRARLSSLSLDMPIAPDLLLRLVSFPTIFLTLIVTIASGALGTVVAFSRRYYSAKSSEELTLSRLFVNVGEGIAAAIAIFLFSGAGMLALTQGGGGAENNVELSPYTVAFIAFLSGFMAEDAFASIQAAGKRIFATEEPNGNTNGTTTNLPAVIPEGEDLPATTAPPSS